MLNRLTQTLDFQADALMLRSERQKIVSTNMANADTPGFVAKDIDFAASLRKAVDQTAAHNKLINESSTGKLQPRVSPHVLSTTSLAHLTNRLPDEAEPLDMKYALNSQSSIDGNTVDMDRERATFADNTVKYEAALRFISGQISTMMTAIKGQG